jgi:hypothetical protein
MRIVHLALREDLPLEAGSALGALLAFPEASDIERRHIQVCLGHLILQAHREGNKVPAEAISPEFAMVTQVQREQTLRTFERRLRDREIAGRMGRALIREAMGLPNKLPRGMKLTLNQLALHFMGRDGAPNPGDTGSFQRRVWGPSKPVIHIAAAIAEAMANVAPPAEYPHMGRLLIMPDFIRKVVEQAAEFEDAALNLPKIAIPSDELIRLRLAS